ARSARQHGYSEQDLSPVTSQLGVLDRESQPWWSLAQADNFHRLRNRTAELRTQLANLQQQLLSASRDELTKQLAAARLQLAQAQQANATDTDVHALQLRIDEANRAQGAAHMVADYR